MTKPDWSTIGGRLQWARGRTEYSQADAGKAAGVSQSTIYLWETNQRLSRGLPERHAKALGRIYGVDPLWLMLGKGHPVEKTPVRSPVVSGRIGAGAHIADTANDAFPLDMDIPASLLEDCEIFEVSGASMRPLFSDGDLVFVERRHTSPQDMLGRLCYVRLADGTRMMKSLQRGSSMGRYNLESYAEETIRDQDIRHCGRIRWAWFAS